jgi:hypothetical protein
MVGNHPFKMEDAGSSPVDSTKYKGWIMVIAESVKLQQVGSSPTHPTIRSIRLVGQDVPLSRVKHGFESRIDYKIIKIYWQVAVESYTFYTCSGNLKTWVRIPSCQLEC